jgi:hypothetical protein
MGALSAAGLLEVWDRGLGAPPARRGLLLLEASAAESLDDLARLPVGQLDARLLALREATFGRRLESLVACPACGERLEFIVTVDDIRRQDGGQVSELELSRDGFKLRFRLPTCLDLEALDGCADAEAGRRHLAIRCLLEARRDDAPAKAEEIPECLVEAMAQAMQEADPQANVELDFTCPACTHGWAAPFDVLTFLWTETDAWARRTLGEVHALAAAYGWNESEILSLSARRRQHYLDLIGP